MTLSLNFNNECTLGVAFEEKRWQKMCKADKKGVKMTMCVCVPEMSNFRRWDAAQSTQMPFSAFIDITKARGVRNHIFSGEWHQLVALRRSTIFHLENFFFLLVCMCIVYGGDTQWTQHFDQIFKWQGKCPLPFIFHVLFINYTVELAQRSELRLLFMYIFQKNSPTEFICSSWLWHRYMQTIKMCMTCVDFSFPATPPSGRGFIHFYFCITIGRWRQRKPMRWLLPPRLYLPAKSPNVNMPPNTF